MTLTTPMKIILALVIIVLIGLGFWLLDWQQKQDELRTVRQQKTDLEQKLATNKDLVKDLPVLTKRKAELEDKLKQVVQTNLVPEKAELFVANYIREIESLVLSERTQMDDPSFEILSITPGALTTQTPAEGAAPAGGAAAAPAAADTGTPEALKSFPTRMFQMSMKGKYATLVHFLYQLGALRLERLVTINKIALAPVGTTEGQASPTLSITIPITAYMRQGG